MNEQFPEQGEWTAQVVVNVYDEFDRSVPSPGLVRVTLTGEDRTLRATLPQDSSICRFGGLTFQTYTVVVEHDGYYTSYRTPWVLNPKLLYAVTSLFPLPSPAMRIDSISCLLHEVVPQVHLRLFCAQTVPAGGWRTAVVFAGLTPQVSSRFGEYVFTHNSVPQAPGSAEILTDDFYRDLHLAGVSTGMRVYVTARLRTGATTESRDTATGLWIFSNLEENSRGVGSFVMP